jgi:hypothetical protein
LNVNGLGINGPGKPWRTTTSPLPVNGCPAYLSSAGFGSNVSTWLTPPLMNSEMTALARGLKCGDFTANGLPISAWALQASLPAGAASSPSWFSRYASARPLMPPPD